MTYRLSTGEFNSHLSATKTNLANGAIHLYSGTMPASPDSAASGTLIVTITKDGGAWTPGTATNGLNFDTPSGATMEKPSADVWKGDAVAAGTIGWGRFVSNSASDTGGASTTLSRHDFDVGITTGACRLAKVTYEIGETVVVQSFTLPASNIS
jgi:hypothetical protein